jgi:FlaA1/EpsC-like NDP-sugar epimerase
MDEGIDIQKMPPNEFLIGKNVSVNQFPRLNIEELLERKPIVLEKKSTIRAYRNKIILLTGAAGSIGSELARQLLLCKPKLLILVELLLHFLLKMEDFTYLMRFLKAMMQPINIIVHPFTMLLTVLR